MTTHITLHNDDFKRHFIKKPLTGVSYDVIPRHFAVALEMVKTPVKERDDLVQTYEWLVVNPKKATAIVGYVIIGYTQKENYMLPYFGAPIYE
jgi:hypothetical protein